MYTGTCISKVYQLFTKQTCFSSLTLSADPVMTSDPSSDMSTAKMAALCPVRVVRRRQREMSHTLACTEIRIRLRMYRWSKLLLLLLWGSLEKKKDQVMKHVSINKNPHGIGEKNPSTTNNNQIYAICFNENLYLHFVLFLVFIFIINNSLGTIQGFWGCRKFS